MNCWPRPIQQPHPPIFIPGGGSIETWDFCIDHDYSYSYLSLLRLPARQAAHGGLLEARRRARRRRLALPRRLRADHLRRPRPTQEAERLYASHILYFFNRCLHVYPGFADAPGYRTIKTLQADVLPQFTPKGLQSFTELTWKDLVEGGFVIAGSPDTVRERMVEMIRGLRVGNVFCLLHMGDMPDEKTRHSTRLFAEHVMPQLRDVWPEWKDDDRFWIKPLAPEQRARAGAAWRRRADGVAHCVETARRPHARSASTRAAAARRSSSCTAPAACFPDDPFLAALARRFRVCAPLLPGYEDSEGADNLRTMLDVTLWAFDVVEALGPRAPDRSSATRWAA